MTTPTTGTTTTVVPSPPAYTPAQVRAMCESKRAYGSFGEAVHVAVKAIDRGTAAHGLRAYRCPVCGCWHLTSTSKHGWRER